MFQRPSNGRVTGVENPLRVVRGNFKAFFEGVLKSFQGLYEALYRFCQAFQRRLKGCQKAFKQPFKSLCRIVNTWLGNASTILLRSMMCVTFVTTVLTHFLFLLLYVNVRCSILVRPASFTWLNTLGETDIIHIIRHDGYMTTFAFRQLHLSRGMV